MASQQRKSIDMYRFVIFYLMLISVDARIHHLKLTDDDRKQVTMSTFGFLKGGTLAINITSFTFESVPPKRKSEILNSNITVFGFTLDKSKSPGLSSYIEGMQGETCILNTAKAQNGNLDFVKFHFNFKENRLMIERLGDDLKNLEVSEVPREQFLARHNLNRRNAEMQDSPSKFSDDFLLGSRRVVREAAAVLPVVTPSPSPSGMVNSTQQAVMTTKPAQQVTASSEDSKLLTQVKISTENGSGFYQAYFLVYIKSSDEEGLYNLFFHNCLKYKNTKADLPISFSMNIEISEDNNGNFLTAGEMPVPVLYFVFGVLFFFTCLAWIYVLHRSKENIYKLHYLMLSVVVVKVFACLFHGVNMHFIQKTGIHEDAWAILWYIVYLTRGALMFVTVLLIGAGWAFIKHVLSDKEKKLFLIVIPLQILDQVAWVITEESEEGNQSYTTWNEIFILVDLLCCGAILFPVVWSIRHLQEASRTDGKAAINLQKLKLFKQFYVMVVCYIYFTRIIVYVMKITLPFRFEWLTDLFKELAMLIFFIVTGIKFRPATDNPYLQVPMDSDDEEIEMDEVITKTGNMETLVRVNQKSKLVENEQDRQHESSHEYD